MSRPWKERTAVYIVRVCEGFKPTSVCQWPESFTEARLHVRNISLTDARATVRAFNKAAMQRRETDVPAWDRQWAIAGCCVRAKGWDRERLFVARPDNQVNPPRGYTSEEIERLLSVCNKARLPEIPGVSPDAWWRGFITVSLFTGFRPGELLEMRCKGGGWLFPWPHRRQSLYTAFRFLVNAAGINLDGRHGLHSLRRTWLERQLQERGDA